MIDRRPQTIPCFLSQNDPRGIRGAVMRVRIVCPVCEGHYGCRGAQTVVVYSEEMP